MRSFWTILVGITEKLTTFGPVFRLSRNNGINQILGQLILFFLPSSWINWWPHLESHGANYRSKGVTRHCDFCESLAGGDGGGSDMWVGHLLTTWDIVSNWWITVHVKWNKDTRAIAQHELGLTVWVIIINFFSLSRGGRGGEGVRTQNQMSVWWLQ